MTEEDNELFESAVESFRRVIDFGIRVSDRLRGERTTEAGELASIVHSKMCANAVSIEYLFSAPLADHSAIIALCRMLMEAMTLFFYLVEPVGVDEWECRKLCIRFHDASARIKFVSGFQSENEYGELATGRESLEQELKRNAFFNSLQREERVRLLTGKHFYVFGMRNAAGRCAGWDGRKFIALYGYLSAHAHSAPMSILGTVTLTGNLQTK